MSLTPIWNYKVLKHEDGNNNWAEGLTPIWNYKVLKLGVLN